MPADPQSERMLDDTCLDHRELVKLPATIEALAREAARSEGELADRVDELLASLARKPYPGAFDLICEIRNTLLGKQAAEDRARGAAEGCLAWLYEHGLGGLTIARSHVGVEGRFVVVVSMGEECEESAFGKDASATVLTGLQDACRWVHAREEASDAN